jgi:hypothetical protein
MTVKRIDIYQVTKGALAEDLWELLYEPETAKITVRHNWDHTNVHNSKAIDAGLQDYTVEEFAETDEGKGMKPRLVAAIAKAKSDA